MVCTTMKPRPASPSALAAESKTRNSRLSTALKRALSAPCVESSWSVVSPSSLIDTLRLNRPSPRPESSTEDAPSPSSMPEEPLRLIADCNVSACTLSGPHPG
eukprot:2253337-Rhodomonas_salina.2